VSGDVSERSGNLQDRIGGEFGAIKKDDIGLEDPKYSITQFLEVKYSSVGDIDQ
jgi:hypothetical protein